MLRDDLKILLFTVISLKIFTYLFSTKLFLKAELPELVIESQNLPTESNCSNFQLDNSADHAKGKKNSNNVQRLKRPKAKQKQSQSSKYSVESFKSSLKPLNHSTRASNKMLELPYTVLVDPRISSNQQKRDTSLQNPSANLSKTPHNTTKLHRNKLNLPSEVPKINYQNLFKKISTSNVNKLSILPKTIGKNPKRLPTDSFKSLNDNIKTTSGLLKIQNTPLQSSKDSLLSNDTQINEKPVNPSDSINNPILVNTQKSIPLNQSNQLYHPSDIPIEIVFKKVIPKKRALQNPIPSIFKIRKTEEVEIVFNEPIKNHKLIRIANPPPQAYTVQIPLELNPRDLPSIITLRENIAYEIKTLKNDFSIRKRVNLESIESIILGVHLKTLLMDLEVQDNPKNNST